MAFRSSENGKSKILLTLNIQFPYMKKYLLIAIAGLLTTAVVTATVSGGKKTTKKSSKCSMKKMQSAKAANTACY